MPLIGMCAFFVSDKMTLWPRFHYFVFNLTVVSLKITVKMNQSTISKQWTATIILPHSETISRLKLTEKKINQLKKFIKQKHVATASYMWGHFCFYEFCLSLFNLCRCSCSTPASLPGKRFSSLYLLIINIYGLFKIFPAQWCSSQEAGASLRANTLVGCFGGFFTSESN